MYSPGEAAPVPEERARIREKSRITAKEMAVMSLFSALMIGSKIAMAAIPNVHLNAVLIFLCVMLFGRKAFYSVAVYVMLEGLVYGFGMWWVSYLYCWPLLTALGLAARKVDSTVLYAAIALVFGLCFGALCQIPYLFVIGWKASVTMWLAGIPYDLIHGISGCLLCLLLLPPLKQLMVRLRLLPGT